MANNTYSLPGETVTKVYRTYSLANETVLRGAIPLAGVSAGTSTDTGTLTATFTSITFGGISAGGSADTGTLTAVITLDGISAGGSDDTGTLTSSTATALLAGTSTGSSDDTGTLTAIVIADLDGVSAGSSADAGTLGVVALNKVVRILSSSGWLDISPTVGYYSTSQHPAGTTIMIPQNMHKLRRTRGLMVTIHDESTGVQEVADITVTTSGDITVTFDSSVAANSKRITIMGPTF